MSITAAKPVTTPIPVQLSEPEFTAFILPHLSMPKRGPKCKLGYYRVFNLILWVLYTGSCTVTVDRRIAPPTAASERSMIVSCHAAPQCSDTCHAYLPGGVRLGPGFSRHGSVHGRLGDWQSGNLVASR